MTAVAKLVEKWRESARGGSQYSTTEYEDGCTAELRRCADELEAALSPAELGGVKAWGVIDQNDEMFEVLLTKAGAENWLDYECDGQTTKAIVPLYTTPRAAEAVTEEMVERMVIAFGREPNWSMLNVEAKRAKARRYLTAALTPPSAKGE